MKKYVKRKLNKGFTLAELLIVTAIIEMLVVTNISSISLGKQEIGFRSTGRLR